MSNHSSDAGLMAINISTNSTVEIAQCSLLHPITWHSSFSNTAVVVSSFLAIIVNFLTMPLTIVANVLILVLVMKIPSLRKERVIALAYLSVTDLLTALISQPLFIASEIYHILSIEPNCTLDSALYACISVLSSASFHHLVMITYERYIAIIHPYKYPAHITVNRLTRASIAIWIFDIFYLIVSFYIALSPLRPYLDLVFYGFGVILLLILLVYFYMKIFIAIHRQRKIEVQQNANQPNVENNTMHNSQISRRRKTLWTNIFLFCSLTLTSIPLTVVAFLMFYFDTNIRGPLFFTFLPFVITLVFFSSLLNPIIYFIRTDEFRYHFRNVFVPQNSDDASENQINPRAIELNRLPLPAAS